MEVLKVMNHKLRQEVKVMLEEQMNALLENMSMYAPSHTPKLMENIPNKTPSMKTRSPSKPEQINSPMNSVGMHTTNSKYEDIVIEELLKLIP